MHNNASVIDRPLAIVVAKKCMYLYRLNSIQNACMEHSLYMSVSYFKRVVAVPLLPLYLAVNFNKFQKKKQNKTN